MLLVLIATAFIAACLFFSQYKNPKDGGADVYPTPSVSATVGR